MKKLFRTRENQAGHSQSSSSASTSSSKDKNSKDKSTSTSTKDKGNASLETMQLQSSYELVALSKEEAGKRASRVQASLA